MGKEIKCDYCDKESLFSCGIIKYNNIRVEIYACEDHAEIALARQQSELFLDEAEYLRDSSLFKS